MKTKIVKTGYPTTTVLFEDEDTVGDVLKTAGVDNTMGFTLAVNGEPTAPSRVLIDGDIIQLIGKVKGGASIEVKLVKFGEDTQRITVPAGSTVEAVLDEAGYGSTGFTLSVNGAPAERATVVNDQDIVQLVPKVKGG